MPPKQGAEAFTGGRSFSEGLGGTRTEVDKARSGGMVDWWNRKCSKDLLHKTSGFFSAYSESFVVLSSVVFRFRAMKASAGNVNVHCQDFAHPGDLREREECSLSRGRRLKKP
jgi:hypothetical protein